MKRREFICGIGGVIGGSAIASLMHIKDREEEGKHIPYFGVFLAAHCNLNCKSCNTFSPIAKEEYIRLREFERDFRKLKELYKTDKWVGYYTGGEPLLNPEIDEIITKTYEIFPRSETAIETNGILLNEKEDSFWEVLKKYKVKLYITKYPINTDRKKYEEKAKEYGVEIKYKEVASKKMYDADTKEVVDVNYNKKGNIVWTKQRVDLGGGQQFKQKFYTCESSKNRIYSKGNLYYCYFHANMENFSKFFNVNLFVREVDYLKLANVKNKEQINRFLSSPNLLCRFCKYCCSPDYQKEVIEWEFSKKEECEWA